MKISELQYLMRIYPRLRFEQENVEPVNFGTLKEYFEDGSVNFDSFQVRYEWSDIVIYDTFGTVLIAHLDPTHAIKDVTNGELLCYCANTTSLFTALQNMKNNGVNLEDIKIVRVEDL